MARKTQTAEQTTVEVEEAPAAQLPVQTQIAQPDAPVIFPRSIVKSIFEIMAEVGHVTKAGNNTFHNYKYAKWSDVLEALNPLMLKHQLLPFQSEISRSVLDKNAHGSILAVVYQFTIVNGAGENWPPIEWTALGRLVDSKGMADDKAAAKCHTQAEKYFLMKLFKIRTQEEGQDLDSDSQGDTVENGKKEPEKPKEPELDRVPHQIIAKAGGKKSGAENWVELYLFAINRAETRTELDAWALANAETMGKIGKMAKESQDEKEKGFALRIHQAFQKRYIELNDAPDPNHPNNKPQQRPLPPRAGGSPASGADASKPTASASAAPSAASAQERHDPQTGELPAKVPESMRRWTKEEEEGWILGLSNKLSGCQDLKSVHDVEADQMIPAAHQHCSAKGWQRAVNEVATAKARFTTAGETKFDGDAWLKSELKTAFDSASNVEELDDVKNKVLVGSRDQLTTEQWKVGVRMYYDRLTEIDPERV